MLDRQVAKEFLEERLKGVETPEDISFEELVETFCQYTKIDGEIVNSLHYGLVM